MRIFVRLLAALVLCVSLVNSALAVTFEPYLQFTLRDTAPVDGLADFLRPSDDSGYVGQVMGPSPASSEEETFLEFDLQSVGAGAQSILHLNLWYSDYVNGTGKKFSLSTYAGHGTSSLAHFGIGNLLDTYLLPSFPNPGHEYALDIDVTAVVQTLVMDKADFLGIRLHDAMFNEGSSGLGIDAATVALGNGTGLFRQTLEVVPEPMSLVYWCGVGICALARGRRRGSARALGAFAG